MATDYPEGTELSHYRVLGRIGAGGMGVVYRALDTRLNRTVALKVITHSLVGDPARRQRFIKEARAAAAFNHPHIVTIYEVDAADGTDFIAMELVSGRSLDEHIRPGGLPLDDVVRYAEQIASAIEAAHTAGVVHRDIKPANIMVSDAQTVKVLDFGLAKLVAPDPDAPTLTSTEMTRLGAVLGSPGYMSPEQAQGHPVGAATDIYSFGVVIREMLNGRTADRPSVPTPRRDAPAELLALVDRCLRADPAQRPSAGEIHRQVSAIRQSREQRASHPLAWLRRRAVALPVAAVIAVGVIAGGVWWASGRGVRAARAQMPEIERLAENYDYVGFYRAAQPALALLPDDLHLRNLWTRMTLIANFDTNPSGAEVWIKGYSAPDSEWIPIGRTPFREIRLPMTLLRVKIDKSGYQPVEAPLNPFGFTQTLDPVAAVPENMVRVQNTPVSFMGSSSRPSDFWIDKYETTNRQFKDFIAAGGYRRPELWKHPIIDRGREIPWATAMELFRDRMNRPGPAQWELGTYPDGQADYPVTGVSWYEAAAFAEFAGKSLPTAFQWRAAAGFTGFASNFADIMTLSNFNNKGPAPVGSHAGLALGTYDMAGNVKEWCWNESADGRMQLGGAWNEPRYMFNDPDARPPLERTPTSGFRLVKNIEPQPAASYNVMHRVGRNYAEETPVDDAAFVHILNQYQYDPLPLNVKVEERQDTPDWRYERVTVDAAYAGEQIIIHLYLPRTSAGPYQSVVYGAGGDAQLLKSSRDLRLNGVDFVVRSGRALVYPVYKGTYERIVTPAGPNTQREVAIARGKDTRRIVDFIQSRPDFDHDRIGYYGLSYGAFYGVLGTAIEPRFRASVLVGGGLPTFKLPPAMDPLNFAPRVRVPTLLINGRDDFAYPLATSQLPLFRLLGVEPAKKDHKMLDGGHIPVKMHDLMRYVLDWFDKYLGPV